MNAEAKVAVAKLVAGVFQGDESRDDLERTARLHGAIPLFGDLGLVMLRPDGVILELAWDAEEAPRPLPEPQRVLALAAGVARYPWLAALLPTPFFDAEICRACRGHGRWRELTSGSCSAPLCEACRGLGWLADLPTGSELEPRL